MFKVISWWCYWDSTQYLEFYIRRRQFRFRYLWCFSTRRSAICDMYRLGIQWIYWLQSFVKVFISFRYQKIWMLSHPAERNLNRNIELWRSWVEERRGEERGWRSTLWCWSWWWWWCLAWPARRSGVSVGCTEIPTHQSSWQETISVPRGKREFLLGFTYHYHYIQQCSNLA